MALNCIVHRPLAKFSQCCNASATRPYRGLVLDTREKMKKMKNLCIHSHRKRNCSVRSFYNSNLCLHVCCRQSVVESITGRLRHAHNSPASHELKQLLQSTFRVGLRFCPLEYIRVTSKQLDRGISGCHLIKPQCIIPENYLVTQADNIAVFNIQGFCRTNTVPGIGTECQWQHGSPRGI